MIKSILRLMWKRRKSSSLMIIEIFISFLLLFALSASTIKNIKLYNQPLGFDYENIWVVKISFNGKGGDEAVTNMKLLKNSIRSIPGVMDVSNSSFNYPYSHSTSSSRYRYKGEEINTQVNIMKTDPRYFKTLNMSVKEGRMYDYPDFSPNETPVVINKALKDKLPGNDEQVIGNIIEDKERKHRIIGVIETYKLKGELAEEEPIMFRLLRPDELREVILIKAQPENEILFEEKLINQASLTVKDWTLRVNKLSEERKAIFKENWTPIIIFSSICAFLILNIILGMFGTLLYNINNRRPEIGLRRSAGASAGRIYFQFIGEMLILTTMGIIPAIIVAIQFPLLKVFEFEISVFVLAIFSAVFIVYLLVLASSFIPSKRATKIQPAIALHEE